VTLPAATRTARPGCGCGCASSFTEIGRCDYPAHRKVNLDHWEADGGENGFHELFIVLPALLSLLFTTDAGHHKFLVMASSTTRTIHGPLTTSFTPPEGCADLAIRYFGQSVDHDTPAYLTPTGTGSIELDPYRPNCMVATDKINTCLPYTKLPSGDPFSPAFYCPSGWTGGATYYPSSYIVRSSDGAATITRTGSSIQPDETRIICCPSGAELDIQSRACQAPAVGTFTATMCHHNLAVPYTKTVITIERSKNLVLSWGSVTYTATQSAIMMGAPWLELIHREQDLSLATPAGTADTSAPNFGPDDNSVDSSGEISHAAKAGIGVGVAIAVVLLAAGLWLFFRRTRARKVAQRDERLPVPFTGKPELVGEGRIGEGAALGNIVQEKAELDNDAALAPGGGTTKSELSGDTQHPVLVPSHPENVPELSSNSPWLSSGYPPAELDGVGRVEMASEPRDGSHHLSEMGDYSAGNTTIVNQQAAYDPTPEAVVPPASMNETVASIASADSSSAPTPTPPNVDDRAARLLALRHEQQRLNVEADRIRHLMSVETEQRRIEEEIRKLEGRGS